MGLVYMYANEGGGFYNLGSDLISRHATFQYARISDMHHTRSLCHSVEDPNRALLAQPS